MALVHRAVQVGADVVALQCSKCGARYSRDQKAEILSFDELQCLDPDCGAGGMIARKQSRLEDRFPLEIATRFVPIPLALSVHCRALGIGAPEIAVIMVLEGHRLLMGDEVWDDNLAERSGLSPGQLKRATGKLVRLGLVKRRRSRMPDGRLGTMRYQLDPLWERLALLTTGHQRPVDEPTGEQNTPPQATSDPWTTGQNRPSPQVTSEPSREEPLEKRTPLRGEPVGTSPAAPDPADLDDDIPFSLEATPDPDEARWRDFLAWKEQHHPDLPVTTQLWARFNDEQQPLERAAA